MPENLSKGGWNLFNGSFPTFRCSIHQAGRANLLFVDDSYRNLKESVLRMDGNINLNGGSTSYFLCEGIDLLGNDMIFIFYS